MQDLKIQNSLSRQKETFKPINEGYIGMYVCGPTVYSDVHLGNCRTFVSFDVIYRYLIHLGYKVRYVRNITDVGHLEGDTDIGREDKISKKARLEQLEPMEIVQRYTIGFHDVMGMLNALPPNIEPRATQHIIEQIEMVQSILDNGYAYENNGSVYFDTSKFAKETNQYGKLSGRKVEELMSLTRDDLKNQEEKRHPSDFAIWIKAAPEHIMRWNSPWSVGFPGWHLECSAMSTKYLGQTFDIHGGGNDLKFPHHENEVAQNIGACGHAPANYWLHTNMLLMNGKKMSKSDGNSITPHQLFTGDSPHVSKGYSPMVLRFFMLQSHYGSTLDLTDQALLAAEKGYKRIMEANQNLQSLSLPGKGRETDLDKRVKDLTDQIAAEMNDDFNTPKALAVMFDLATIINRLKGGQDKLEDITADTLKKLQETYSEFLFDVFGLKDETAAEGSNDAGLTNGLMEMIIEIRKEAKANKDWNTADLIRNKLNELGVQLKDNPEGTTWSK
ncbi:MAG: cysteine--tRNA ligase [Bacteroidetes bacterium]|nr:cysteine--tRNA ligase [Bacteroidota bacterium]